MSSRILVVDDEPDILELVRLNLSQDGHSVDTAANGEEAMERMQKNPPDLVILDLMLPDLPGTDICREMRRDPALKDIPVIMLTAKGNELDRVVGFELGADDYVTKPFSPRELLLRVKAILRRRRTTNSPSSKIEYGEIVIDVERHRCRVAELELSLTAKEFGLLSALMSRPGRVMTRERLLEQVWGDDTFVSLRTIDTHMKRLREKLGASGTIIDTIRGAGYRFGE